MKTIWIASRIGHSLRQKTPKERKLYSCVDPNGHKGNHQTPSLHLVQQCPTVIPSPCQINCVKRSGFSAYCRALPTALHVFCVYLTTGIIFRHKMNWLVSIAETEWPVQGGAGVITPHTVRPRARRCPSEKRPGTHCTGGWVALRAGLDGSGK
jgi:hypothetical protein